MIRVLIADDSIAIQDSLSSLLNRQSDFEVVGTASDGLEAVEMASLLMPHVVIMDAQMSNLDGVEATERIKQAFPNIGVLFFSVYTDYVEAGVAAGSDGYLTKDCEAQALFAEIRRIASNLQESCQPACS